MRTASFRISVKMLADSDQDCSIYTKLFFLGLAISIVWNLATAPLRTFESSTSMGAIVFLLMLVVGIFSLVLHIVILSNHYGISKLRALAVHLLRFPILLVLFPFFVLLVMLPVSAGIGFAFYSSLDSLVLRPLDLV